LADGWQVRALTRKPQGKPARKLAALGAEVIKADMGDPSTLSDAFRGPYGVYSVQNTMTSGVEAEIRHGRNVANAAKEAGVHHVVYGSAGLGVPGTGVPSWESKLAVEAHMHQLGLPLSVLRPMAFMELMTDKDFFPPVSAWYLMPKLMGAHRPLPWICADDLGAISDAAHSLIPTGSSAQDSSSPLTSVRLPSAARYGQKSRGERRAGSPCRNGCSSASSAPTSSPCGGGCAPGKSTWTPWKLTRSCQQH
jgi:nucleoside-diphosphate-sugar epimerase